MNFFNRVEAGLAMRGMDVATLARRMEISTAAIYKWRSKDSEHIKSYVLITLARVLELNPIWLYDGTGEPSLPNGCSVTKELCDIYKHLPESSKDALLTMARALLASTPPSVANPFPPVRKNSQVDN